jgi:hypothetical protein
MTNINRQNYEAFFLDYLEGNLSPSQKEELIDFIEKNPDLKKELNEWEDIQLTPSEEIKFSGKQDLKKKQSIFPDESPFEEQCIAKIEGDLGKHEERLFNHEIKTDINKHKTYSLYKQTKLLPDHSITYPHKSSLKAKTLKTTSFFTSSLQPVLATAASITLIVGLFYNTQTDQTNINQNYAEIEKINLNKHIEKKNFNGKYSNDNKINIKHTKDLNIDFNNYLPIAKVENLNAPISSNTQILKLQPISITQLKHKQTLLAEKASKKRFTIPNNSFNPKNINRNTLFSIESSRIKPELLYANKGNSGISLLDIADLGFKGISKLTGKDIALERTYNKNGNLKRLAFKTESFSISTNIEE